MLTKDRLIYTAGTFSIDEDLARARRLIIRSSVLRLPPTTNYQNEKSNPPKYFLGYCTVFINDYVYQIFPIEFKQQIILFWDNPGLQNYARMLCEFANVNTNLVAHRTSIPLAGALVLLPNDPGTFSGCPFTRLKFKLLFGARLQISATGEPLETCDEANPATTVPNLDPPPNPYPPDQARDEDPARSLPEEGELPGDTAIATIDDPDLGLVGIQCFKILNKGILSGDIVFENFICAVSVYTEPGTPYAGVATVNIVALGEGGTEVLRANQASYASNAVTIVPGADDNIRQPNYSYGNCNACSPSLLRRTQTSDMSAMQTYNFGALPTDVQ